jgi:hypothetical protein
VKTRISTLLLIPICSLPVGVAYSADAPDADVKLRIAAISVLPLTALPKTPTRAVAGDIESRPSTVGAAVPHVAARYAPISHQNATATASARGGLDLRPPDLRSLPRIDSLLPGSIPADSDEPQAAAVVTAALPVDETSNTNLSPDGIGSLYWATRHPTQAWRILTPRQAGDEFGAYMGIRTKCAAIPSAPGGLSACP